MCNGNPQSVKTNINMRIISTTGREDLATVYTATINGKYVEFVESLQPPLDISQKWVLIVSTLSGCPIKCKICDAGDYYKGKLTIDEILSQIDYMVLKKFPDRKIKTKKFKIQFARVGEPAFNPAVLEVIDKLKTYYLADGIMPCISTIAPEGYDYFFEKLLKVKKEKYPHNFQLQFSIHTTDPDLREWLIPAKKWNLDKIAMYGERFYDPGGRKITLNFAINENSPVDSDILLKHYNPDIFLIKLTPINPTYNALHYNLAHLDFENYLKNMQNKLTDAGYEVIISIGELEENKIGSNCGQFIKKHRYTSQVNRFAYKY